jgi:hypothetical protein
MVLLVQAVTGFSQSLVLEESTYEGIFNKLEVAQRGYKARIKELEDCPWGDLTFLARSWSDRTGAPLYGLGNYGWGESILRTTPLVSELGIRYLRCGFAEDKYVERAARSGVSLVLLLHDETSYRQNDLKAWTGFVRRAVLRYGKGGTFWSEHPELKPLPVRYFEIMNEPNIDFVIPPADTDPDQIYFEFLRSAYETIKSIDPDARVIAFQTSGGTIGSWDDITYFSRFDHTARNGQKMKFFGWLRFINAVHSRGGHRYYDVVGLHPYSQPYGPDYKGHLVKALMALRAEMRRCHVEQKPVWFTEVGYPMRYGDASFELSDQKQADFLLRLHGICIAHGVERVESFHFEDFWQEGDRSSKLKLFGFFDHEGKPRKQALALATMIRLLPNPRLIRTLNDGSDGYYAYVFSGANQTKVTMLWLAGEETYMDRGRLKYRPEEKRLTKELDVADGLALKVDMYGQQTLLAPEGERVRVEVSPQPVFVVHQPAPQTAP